MGRMDPSHRFAQQIIDAANNALVNLDTAVSLCTMSGPAIKVKLFRMAVTIIQNLSLEYDYDAFDIMNEPDHARAVITAKRLQEVLDQQPTLP